MPKRLTERERALRDVPEALFQTQVGRLLTVNGWRWFHCPANVPRNGYKQNIRAGFPDICAVRGIRLVFAELKKETGRPTDEQIGWLDSVAVAGAEAYIWRPSDMDEIVRVLARPGQVPLF